MEKNLEQLLGELADLQKKIPANPISIDPAAQPWSKGLIILLSCLILGFGLLVLLTMSYLIIKGKEVDQILRLCALPLIIVASIFLVVTGYTSEQIAPVMGLLGTIAGYLLGSKKTSH